MLAELAYGTLAADGLAFIGCALSAVDQEHGHFRRVTPRVVAAVSLWPATLVLLVAWGLYEWIPGRAPLDPNAEGEQLLSPRQRKQLAYDRAQVQIHTLANNEIERTHRIITGELEK